MAREWWSHSARAGWITRTAVPPVGDAVSFVVGPDRAVLVRLGSVADYLVPDGQPARTMSGSLSTGLPVLPGPDQRHVWVQSGTSSTFHAVLVGLDGRSTGVSVPIPASSSDVVSDGAGYPLFSDTGGVYDARPAGVRLITTGALIAIGRPGGSPSNATGRTAARPWSSAGPAAPGTSSAARGTPADHAD